MSQPFPIPVIDTARDDAEKLLAELREKLSPRGDVVSEAGRQRTIELFGEPLAPQQVVERICRDVRRDGLPAVLDYTRKLDGRDLSTETMRVTAEELQQAHSQADAEFLATIGRIRENLAEFGRRVLPENVTLHRDEGDGRIELSQRYWPLQRVGLCVPGGAAAYPSTLLMTAVPAQTAGVAELAVVVPPTDSGGYNTDLLATCHELGIEEVYRIGGAQAVAALAYGVEGIPQVDKIAGPGNLFVALAKRHVFGEVDIDGIAGPSEIVLIADETARPDFLAADLIAQAEHSPGCGVLITWQNGLIDAVRDELDRQLNQLPRGELAGESLKQYGALIHVPNAAEAARLSDLLAPEHLHIATDDAPEFAERIRNAGAIFLGHDSPVALGDYVAGPSHVLPTGGTARFAGGLSAGDFLRRSSLISYNREALRQAADDVRLIAHKEGLTAHAASVDIRLRTAE